MRQLNGIRMILEINGEYNYYPCGLRACRTFRNFRGPPSKVKFFFDVPDVEEGVF